MPQRTLAAEQVPCTTPNPAGTMLPLVGGYASRLHLHSSADMRKCHRQTKTMLQPAAPHRVATPDTMPQKTACLTTTFDQLSLPDKPARNNTCTPCTATPSHARLHTGRSGGNNCSGGCSTQLITFHTPPDLPLLVQPPSQQQNTDRPGPWVGVNTLRHRPYSCSLPTLADPQHTRLSAAAEASHACLPWQIPCIINQCHQHHLLLLLPPAVQSVSS